MEREGLREWLNSPEMQQFRKDFAEAEAIQDAADDQWWRGLSEDDRLQAFRHVCRLIHKGDIEDKGSYRYVLYDIFGFGPEGYGEGMRHYMKIHNCLVIAQDLQAEASQGSM